MTNNEREALVERLREEADGWDEPKSEDEVDMRGMFHRAADRIEALSAENKRLREALWFYANNKNYRYIIGTGCTSVDIDAGDTARAALGDTK